MTPTASWSNLTKARQPIDQMIPPAKKVDALKLYCARCAEAVGTYLMVVIGTGVVAAAVITGAQTPARLTACVDSPRETAPLLGEHNTEILCSLGGMTPEEVSKLEAEGAL